MPLSALGCRRQWAQATGRQRALYHPWERAACLLPTSARGPPTGSSEDRPCPFASLGHHQHKVRSVSQSTANICGVESKTIGPRHAVILGADCLQVGKPQVHKWVTHDPAGKADTSLQAFGNKVGMKDRKAERGRRGGRDSEGQRREEGKDEGDKGRGKKYPRHSVHVLTLPLPLCPV